MKLKNKIGKGNIQINNRNFVVGGNKILSNNPITIQNFNKFKAEQTKKNPTLKKPKNEFKGFKLSGNAFSDIPMNKVSGEEIANKNNFGSFIDDSGKLQFNSQKQNAVGKKSAKQIELEERGIK